jgi:hypothetical protein
MTKKNRFRLIAAASVNCDFPAGLERFQAKHAPELIRAVAGSRDENA